MLFTPSYADALGSLPSGRRAAWQRDRFRADLAYRQSEGACEAVTGDACGQVTASLQERRPRTMKHADTFAVFDDNGDALAGPGSPEGIYHRDTRYLSHPT